MVCYTRPKNLRDELVRAKLPRSTGRRSARKKPDGFHKCSGFCRFCPYVGDPHERVVKEVTVSLTGEKIPIRATSLARAAASFMRVTARRRTEDAPTAPNILGRHPNGQRIGLLLTKQQ